MEDITRAKAGKWEKVGNFAMVTVLFPTLILSDLLEEAGIESFWARMGILTIIIVAGTYLVYRPAAAERRKRLAVDLKYGIFDCAIRFPTALPGSLRDLWEGGAAQADDQGLAFQTQQGTYQSEPAGKKRTYSNPVPLGPVEMTGKKVPGWGRNWEVLELQTDSGRMHLAAAPSALALLRKRFNPAID